MTNDLKADLLWPLVVATCVVTMSFTSFVWSRIKMEQPEPITYKFIIEHVQAPHLLTEAQVVQQAIFPIPPGRRRPIEEQLSPEMIRAIENASAKEIFRVGRDPFK